MADTFKLRRSELGEDLARKLHATVESASKGEELNGEAHPWLAEQGIALRDCALYGANVPCSNTTADQT